MCYEVRLRRPSIGREGALPDSRWIAGEWYLRQAEKGGVEAEGELEARSFGERAEYSD